MGAIVLSMLLCWFAVVAALTIWSGNHEDLAEDSARSTGGPLHPSDEP